MQRAEEAVGRRGSLPDAPYQPTLRDTMCFHAITMMKVPESKHSHYILEDFGVAFPNIGSDKRGRLLYIIKNLRKRGRVVCYILLCFYFQVA